jgi:hypothetical protein
MGPTYYFFGFCLPPMNLKHRIKCRKILEFKLEFMGKELILITKVVSKYTLSIVFEGKYNEFQTYTEL